MNFFKLFLPLIFFLQISPVHAEDVTCEKYISYGFAKESSVIDDVVKSPGWSSDNADTLKAALKDYTPFDFVTKGTTFCINLHTLGKGYCSLKAKAVLGIATQVDQDSLPGDNYSISKMLKRFLSEYKQEQMIDENKLSKIVSEEICTEYLDTHKHKGL